MKSAPLHPKEQERLASLERLNILDTLPELDFDDLTLIASQICETPIALVSLVDSQRQWFKSKVGLAAQETPREVAFCAHAILGDELFEVPDSRLDERFSDNPLVTGNPNVVFYAGAPLLSPDGQPIGTLCVIDHTPKSLSEAQKSSLAALSRQVTRLLDLRQQIELEKQLAVKLEYKKVAVENLSEGVVLQDSEFRIIEFNAAALEVLGLSASQLTGKTSMDPDWRSVKADGSPFPGSEHPAVLALTTGKVQKDVLMGIHTPEAELRWLNVNSTPIFISNQAKPTHAVTSFSDVTAERTANLVIERNQIYLKRILDNIPAMIGHWDRDLNNLNANRVYSDYFGVTPEEMKGKSIRNLLGPELFELNFPYMKKALAGEAQTFERAMPMRDGRIRQVLANYLPDIQGDEVTGFFAIVTDITDLKALEYERQQLAAKMIESAKLSSLGEMAGGIAHELNTPLAIIIAKAGMLLDAYADGKATPEESIRQIEKINLTAERMAKIIKGLRLFSRNSTTDSAETFLISNVVEATLDLCHEKLVHSQISLIQDVDKTCETVGKFTELSQVLMNLVSNAIDAIEPLPSKWIKIHVSQTKELCSIRITDSGEGIPEHLIDKIMHPFFTTKEVGKGTGLGLSISSGIVKSHGGRLWYDRSQPNTCFVIELPRLIDGKNGTAA